MTDEEQQKSMTLGPVTIVRAFRPGDVVFIETTQHYPLGTLDSIRKYLEAASDRFGVKMILLDCGMKVAAANVVQS